MKCSICDSSDPIRDIDDYFIYDEPVCGLTFVKKNIILKYLKLKCGINQTIKTAIKERKYTKIRGCYGCIAWVVTNKYQEKEANKSKKQSSICTEYCDESCNGLKCNKISI